MPTIRDIAKVIAAKHQLKSHDAEAFANAVVDTIIEGLQGDRLVKIKGFGTFKLTAVKDRESVNVNTGERVIISGHDKISFTPDSVMKDLVNKPFAQFETVILADGVSFDEMPDDEKLAETTNEQFQEEELSETPDINLYPVNTDDSKVDSETVMISLFGDKKVEVEQDAVDAVVTEEEETTAEGTTAEGTTAEGTTAEEKAVETKEETVKTETEVENTISVSLSESENALYGDTLKDSDGSFVVTNDAEENDAASDEKQGMETKLVLNDETGSESSKDETNTILQPLEKEGVMNEINENNENIERRHRHHRHGKKTDAQILYLIVTNILVAAVFFTLGYLCCSNNWLGLSHSEEIVQYDESDTIVSPVVVVDTLKLPQKGADVNEKKEEPQAVKTQVEKKAEDVNNKPVDEIKKQESSKVPEQTAYDKDPRVRTGAYNIVGTMTVVKVKQGQTTKSLAKTYLGEGMECYIEAYNGGVNELKEGMEIKIPKVQLKKKK